MHPRIKPLAALLPLIFTAQAEAETLQLASLDPIMGGVDK